MQPANRCYNRATNSTAECRYVLRLFAFDLTASDTARLMDLRGQAVNALYLRLRRRLQTWCPVSAELGEAVELGEICFGPRRVHGKRGRGASGKTICFVLLKRGGQVYIEFIPSYSKMAAQA